jgi:hypothetical protein
MKRLMVQAFLYRHIEIDPLTSGYRIRFD